jgi:uncharacterized protein (TIGR03437 family)
MGSRLLSLGLLCCPLVLFAANVPISAALPAGVLASNVAVDGAGRVYVAGTLQQGYPFVARLNADATGVDYLTTFPSASSVAGLAVTPDGRTFVVGSTSSMGFPATANWAGAAYPSSGINQPPEYFYPYGFAAGLNADGSVIYSGAMGAIPAAVAVNPSGEAYLSGRASQIVATPDALSLPGDPAAPLVSFVMELDSSGTHVLFVMTGVGGNLALDSQGSIYIAGSTSMAGFPTTPGAYQASFQPTSCPVAIDDWFLVIDLFPCPQQYVAKVTSDGAALVYSTFVTGHDSSNAGIAVDSAGNVYVAGTTAGTYPVTPGALQTTFPSRSSPGEIPLPASAYVSKLNAAGTALLVSTYLGGSGYEAVSGVAVDAGGNLIVSGATDSPDFPGIASIPERCLPENGPIYYAQGFVARLAPDGSALTAVQLFPGNVIAHSLALAGSRAWVIDEGVGTDGPAQSALALPGVAGTPGGPFVAAVDLAEPTPAASLACVLDAADYSFLGPIAPGELITLFGSGLGPVAGIAAQPSGGAFPDSLAGVAVTFGGVPAPLLYASGGQVNVVAPYELAGSSATTMQIAVGGVTVAERVMTVVESQPHVFASAPITCQYYTYASLVLNADGTRNSCTNPAAAGSVVSVFLDGLGVTGTQLPNGTLNPPNPPALTVPITLAAWSGATLDSASAAPNQVSGVWQIRLMPESTPDPSGLKAVQLTVGGVLVSDQVLIW